MIPLANFQCVSIFLTSKRTNVKPGFVIIANIWLAIHEFIPVFESKHSHLVKEIILTEPLLAAGNIRNDIRIVLPLLPLETVGLARRVLPELPAPIGFATTTVLTCVFIEAEPALEHPVEVDDCPGEQSAEKRK